MLAITFHPIQTFTHRYWWRLYPSPLLNQLMGFRMTKEKPTLMEASRHGAFTNRSHLRLFPHSWENRVLKVKMAIVTQLYLHDKSTKTKMQSGLFLWNVYPIPWFDTPLAIELVPLTPWCALGCHPYVFGAITNDHLQKDYIGPQKWTNLHLAE